MGTLRGRGGYVRDNALIYGTVGLAISDIEIEPVNLGPHDAVRAGIVLGLGSDLAVGDHWLVRVEGLAAFYPDDDIGFAGIDRTVEHRQATIRFGIARKL
jgi:opacity protein-like surface antigen